MTGRRREVGREHRQRRLKGRGRGAAHVTLSVVLKHCVSRTRVFVLREDQGL